MSTTRRSHRGAYILVGVLGFLLLDRLALLWIPEQYRPFPDRVRYHSRYFTEKIDRFLGIQDQVEVVFLGDSRTRHGIDPSRFASQQGSSRVSVYNLAPASSGIEFTDRLVRSYLLDRPNLKTVAWGLSPRIFNRYWMDPVHQTFLSSGGYQMHRRRGSANGPTVGVRALVELGFDRALGAISMTYAYRSLLKAKLLDLIEHAASRRHFQEEPAIAINPWGFMTFPPVQTRDVSDPLEVERMLRALESSRFELDEERLRRFRDLIDTLGAHGIALFGFIPPMHPSLESHPAADADGTPNDDYAAVIATLRQLEVQHGNFSLIDAHQAGHHNFPLEDFADFDHVNEAGSRRLTARVEAELATLDVRMISFTPAPKPTQRISDDPVAAAARKEPEFSVAATGTDRTPPKLRSHLGQLGYGIRSYPPDNRPTLWAEYDDVGSGIDPSSVRFFMQGEDVTENCIVSASRISFRPAATLDSPMLYQFKVIVADREGNTSDLTWEILLKPC